MRFSECFQVVAYLLCTRLAGPRLLPDTPDTRHGSGGQVGREQLGGCVTVAVERGWRLRYGLKYGGGLAVAYFTLLTGSLATGATTSTGPQSFAFFALAGFAAGLSERFATDMLERSGQLLGASSNRRTPKDQP